MGKQNTISETCIKKSLPNKEIKILLPEYLHIEKLFLKEVSI